jgi:hypothetical protein
MLLHCWHAAGCSAVGCGTVCASLVLYTFRAQAELIVLQGLQYLQPGVQGIACVPRQGESSLASSCGCAGVTLRASPVTTQALLPACLPARVAMHRQRVGPLLQAHVHREYHRVYQCIISSGPSSTCSALRAAIALLQGCWRAGITHAAQDCMDQSLVLTQVTQACTAPAATPYHMLYHMMQLCILHTMLPCLLPALIMLWCTKVLFQIPASCLER